MNFSTHQKEWMEGSAISSSLTDLNLSSIEGVVSLDWIFQSLPDSERINTGAPQSKWLKRYSHCWEGGWKCRTFDLSTLQPSDWGCFKPDQPIKNWETGKVIKYEHPLKTSTELFSLYIDLATWQSIAKKQRIEVDFSIYTTSTFLEVTEAFWQWVIDNPEVKVVITEGAKKTACLLSNGYVAVGLPGIFNGYRSPKDKLGNKIGSTALIPQLEALAVAGREFVIAFDQDIKLTTRQNVATAVNQLSRLFKAKGCSTSVLSWKHKEKGIDDLVVSHGYEVLDQLFSTRLTIDPEKNSYKLATSISNLADVIVHQQYLDLVEFKKEVDKAQLIALSSLQKTGKTELIGKLQKEAELESRRALGITHRVQLGLALSKRFSIPYCDDSGKKTNGYFLCIDSLHYYSRLKFDPQDWVGSFVFIDEVEQVLWHLLSSHTCEKEMALILDTLRKLLRTVVDTGGKIIVADANLSPVTIKLLNSLIGKEIKTFIVHNTYKPCNNNVVIYFDGNNADELLFHLDLAIENDDAVYIATDGQRVKSKKGTSNLYSYFSKKYPDKKILRADRETVSDPTHEAYRITSRLEDLKNYDIVIASPVLETGISIDFEHFDSVWGIFHGQIPTDSIIQAMQRVRANVPRFLWVRKHGSVRIGNGSFYPCSLKKSSKKEYYFDRRLIDSQYQEIDDDFDPYTTAWSEYGATKNYQYSNYREVILDGFSNLGYLCLPFTEQIYEENNTPKELSKELALNAAVEYEKEKAEIVASPEISNDEYKNLDNSKELTRTQRNSLRKEKIRRLYKQDEVTKDLVEKDDNGWYGKINLHYYLTKGSDFLVKRDKKKLESISTPTGQHFIPTANKHLLSGKVKVLSMFDVEQFLVPGKMFCKNTLFDWWRKIKDHLWEINQILRTSLTSKSNPITAARALVNALGLKLECIGRVGPRGKQVRIYQVIGLDDGREDIFDSWYCDHMMTEILEERDLEKELEKPKKKIPDISVATISI